MASFGMVLILLVSQVTYSFGFLLDDNSLQNLIGLMNQEKSIRKQVEADMQALQSDINAAKSQHKSSLCKCPASGIVAFSASRTTELTNFGTNQVLVFDSVLTNVGGAYDPRHGSFLAPESGIYKFTVSILQGQSSMWLALELVKNDKVISRVKTGDNGYWNMGTNSVNVHLDAGDDVFVRHMSDSDTKHVVGEKGMFTMFTGHLIHAD